MSQWQRILSPWKQADLMVWDKSTSVEGQLAALFPKTSAVVWPLAAQPLLTPPPHDIFWVPYLEGLSQRPLVFEGLGQPNPDLPRARSSSCTKMATAGS